MLLMFVFYLCISICVSLSITVLVILNTANTHKHIRRTFLLLFGESDFYGAGEIKRRLKEPDSSVISNNCGRRSVKIHKGKPFNKQLFLAIACNHSGVCLTGQSTMFCES